MAGDENLDPIAFLEIQRFHHGGGKHLPHTGLLT